MRNKFNEVLILAMQRDDISQSVEFDNENTTIYHLDGSVISINGSKLEKTEVMGLPCLLLYGEHVSPMIFVEYDLKEVLITISTGKTIKYPLCKDPNITPIKMIKKTSKKVVKKSAKKSVKKVSKPTVKKKAVKKVIGGSKSKKKLLLEGKKGRK